MARIHALSAIVANQIAAGEVVERPASVIKELIENSLDAKATVIEINVQQGGLSLIRVQDNGEGILKEDLPLSLSRHATSKVASLDDLSRIQSLGFRGEALASIVSVAKCVISSKPPKQEQAWSCSVRGDDLIPYVFESAPYEGTVVEVRDLFYNTPARRRFLKSIKTELNHIEVVLKNCALSNHHVSFKLIHNDKVIREYKRGQQLQSRVAQILGNAFIYNSCHLDSQHLGYRFHGWLGNRSTLRKNSELQFFFVNGRSVRERLVQHAIKKAMLDVGYAMDEGYASYALYLECPLDEVDINVHPTKHEVRFSDSSWVHDYLLACAKKALAPQSVSVSAQVPDVTVLSRSDKNLSPVVPVTSLSLGLEVFKAKVTKTRSIVWEHFLFYFGDQIYTLDMKEQSAAIWLALMAQVKEFPFPARLCLFPKKVYARPEGCECFGIVIRQNRNGSWMLHEVPGFLKEEDIESLVVFLQKKVKKEELSEFFCALPWNLFTVHPYFEDKWEVLLSRQKKVFHALSKEKLCALWAHKEPLLL